MSNLLEKSINFGFGLFAYSKEKIEVMVDELVKKGDINKSEAQGFIKELIEKGDRQKSELKSLIKESMKEVFDLKSVPGKDEIRAIIREEIEKIQKEQAQK